MTTFADLPPELLEDIFHLLGSIDDVHHLGRACKKTYDVIGRQSIYVEIMRSIITRSPQHRYDQQLSEMLELHKDITQRMQQNASQLPTTRNDPQGYVLNEWEKRLQSASTPDEYQSEFTSYSLSDESVYQILTRYQGLRVLEHLWLERQFNESDMLAADNHFDHIGLTDSYQYLINRAERFQEEELCSRDAETPETAAYVSFDPDQRARFYSAVTQVWLLNEMRWVLTNFAYPSPFDVQVKLLERCKKSIFRQRKEPLLDELDNYAIFKFLYHHLLPSCGPLLADRTSSTLPFTFPSEFDKQPGRSGRLLQLYLTAGQTYLQPPDLIDLVVRGNMARNPPWPILSIPRSTEIWQRPSQAFTFPANIHICDANDREMRTISRASLTHLGLISRSSFHQTRDDISQNIATPADDALFNLHDHSNNYFHDRALAAFELYEDQTKDLRNIRDVFPDMWSKTLWSVWWWANSEDKARAKMERWRK